MKVRCPHCQAGLNVPDEKVGTSGKCPKCGQRFTAEVPATVPAKVVAVAQPKAELALADQEEDEESGADRFKEGALIVGKKALAGSMIAAKTTARTTGVAARAIYTLTANYMERRAERKAELALRQQELIEAERLAALQPMPCPFCGEPIARNARKCKHCNEYLDDKLRQPAQPQIVINNTSTNTNTVTSNAAAAATAAVVGGGGPRRKRWSRFVAFVVSVIPGLGQFYKGSLLSGLAWFILVTCCYIVPPVGLVMHFICACAAASGDPYA